MKPLVLLFSLLFLSACSTTQQTSDLTLPELVYQHPLPPYPKPLSASHLRIDLKLLVTENGSVGDVIFQSGSGNLAWDTTAMTAIRQWKYSPARFDKKPVSIWLRQTAIVQFSEPRYILLGEIQFTDEESADSAFALLEQGKDFSEVVEQFSIAPSRFSNGSLGEINVQIFPEQIKTTLMRLHNGNHTTPLKYGDHFVIFKRLEEKSL